MTKNEALKRSSLARPARALSPIQHEGAAILHHSISPFTARMLDKARQGFGANGDTLDSLVENIVENLSEGSEERGQMIEFLKLLLDTDPALGEEILAGVSQTK